MGTTDRDDLFDVLAEGVAALTDSDRWRRHLEVQSRFHRYSYGNVLLIAAQCPEATRVAGFGTWKRLGRSVRRGERAIWILAPMVARRSGTDAPPPAGPAGSEPGAGSEPTGPRIRGFRPVAVFDLSQTEGDDLPEVCRTLEGGDPDGRFASLVAVAGDLGYTVRGADLPGATNGDCTFATRSIRVERRNPPAQQVKTLAHELAHALLHEGAADRALAELEAESTAFVVCRALGLDTADYSFGYVACWAGGGPEALAAIKASCGRIQQAAGHIVAGVEATVPGAPVDGIPAAA